MASPDPGAPRWPTRPSKASAAKPFAAKPFAAKPSSHRPRAARPLADLIGPCVGDAFARMGFAHSEVIYGWRDIVGPRLGLVCEPVRLEWPRRTPDWSDGNAAPAPATLHVRVEPAFALELQYQASALISRVNACFGYACVGRIALKQGAVMGAPAPARPAPPGPQALAAAQAIVGDAGSPQLNAALARLGAAIIAREGA